MTVTTADLFSEKTRLTPTYDLHVTLVRYVHAHDYGGAVGIGSAGLELTHGDVPASSAQVETIVARQPSAAPYHHADREGLWRVSIDIDATVRATSEEDASETARQLVTISSTVAASDAFESELEVWPAHRG